MDSQQLLENEIDRKFAIIPGSCTDYAGVERLQERFPEYKEGLDWIRDFISKPDKNLGRAGDVCPFTTPAMNQNLLRLVAIQTSESTSAEAVEKCGMLIDLFLHLFESVERPEDAALLAFFPNISRMNAGAFVDGGHRALRLEFVKRGFMLGEFHLKSDVGSVRNGNFKVMQSPVPMFVVRKLSVHDLKFLDRPIYPDSERREYLTHYRRFLFATLGHMMMAEVDKRIQALAVEHAK